ncbi:hypothetical protein ACFWPX_03305 [Nocardia sp. NPDC058518]|uniref:hypothetical protein n=1 Tax=Nocardia sp. NPDC058518 TaxID=3346534 RepID=UPI003646A3E2
MITVVTVVLIVAATVLVVGRDDTAPEPGSHTPGTVHKEGPDPVGADAMTVTGMGLAALFSWQPRTDPSPGTGLTRAASWLTGELAAAANGGVANGVAPLPEWARWRESNDVICALVDAEQATFDEAETTVAAMVTQQVLHQDGSTTLYRRMHVTVTVTHTAQGWRMSSYRINSVTGHG